MKKVRNIFFIFVFTFAMIALASCTVIDDTHIHCFEDGVCDCGDLEENYPEVKKYNVVLVDGANVIASFEVLEGTLVQAVEAPEKVGQVFAGWFNGDVKWDFNKMPVVGELELEARYIDNAKYEIVYQLNGGEFVGEVETTYVSGIGLNKLPEPVRSNYIFLGWYLNGEKVDSISNSQMGSLTLVAKWESVNYDIAYELNGGSFYDGAKIPDNYAEGVGLAELPVARRDSYVFDGWMLEGKLIDAIDPEHVGDVTLSAKWTPVVYTISYQLNGGELLEEATEEYTIEDLVDLPAIQKVGYTFNGWLLNGDKVESIEVGTSGNLVLVADWEVNQYTLTINVDGVKEEVEYDYNEAVEAIVDPVKVGYTFAGWDKAIPAKMPAEDVEIKATWAINQYTLTINVDGVKEEVEYDYNEAVEALEAPTKVGYTFAGWSPVVPAKMPAEDVEVVATWTINQYTLTINVDGVKEEVEYDYNEAVEALEEPAKVGYTFAGWSPVVPANMPAEDLEVVATWTINHYTLTINVDGVKEEVVYDYNEAVEAIEDPAKVGYTFAGWDKAVPANMPAEDVEIKATWTINQYTLTINVDGVKEEVEYDYNEAVEAIEEPAKVGYTFAGWSPVVPANMPAEDLEVVATWTINHYTLTINVDGVKEEVVYDYNEAVEAIEDPVKVGYTFAGWDKAVPAKMPAEDVEIKATWNLVEYTITYESEYGHIAKYPTVDAAIADFLADYNVARGKSHTPETFAALGSWGEISDASLFLYNATYRAKWAWLVDYIASVAGSANKKAYQNFNNYNSQAELNAANSNYIYSIAYELRGWVGQFKYTKNANFVTADYSDPAVSNAMFEFCKLPETYTVESEDIILPELSADGYNFLGWYLGEEEVEKVAQGTTGNLTLTTKWDLVEYTITYESEYGHIAKYPTVDAAIADFLADYNVARGKSHTPETFAALGSWGEISDASLFLYNATYRAKWAWLVDYIASVAGSANKKAYQNFNNYNSQAELNAANSNYIYSIAYELRGWVGQLQYTKNSNYITADYSNQAISEAMFGFCKLPEAYTVESEDIILPELSVDGCIFLGWYLGEDKVEKVAQGTTGNLTLVAKWSANVVNVTYDFNGGLSQELYFENGVSTSRIEGTSYNGNFWGEFETCIFIYTQDKDPAAKWSDRIFVKLNTETGLYEVVSVLASGVTNAWPDGADYVIVLSGSHNNYDGLKGSFANVSVGDIAVFASDVAGASNGSPVEIRFFESAITEDTITKSYHNGGELLSATKPGSTFLGWYDSSDNKYESVDEITEDITLIAKWS